ncbi:ComEA family DNA-binding protein [Balneatrix alpica]|uniref:ComEA family DNA-binding protein n=1 Tax=Balneatrix alpica TaxID=75684 RepID=A0ABV5ZDU5_9GAMM|nr:helix-hairpin-helix domain-containing protein [Balneatrix alpica]
MKLIKTLLLAMGMMASLAWAAGEVDINKASAQEIADALKGIGVKKAEAIVAWREQNGPFTNIEDLLQVKGVGTATLEQNKDKIIVSK